MNEEKFESAIKSTFINQVKNQKRKGKPFICPDVKIMINYLKEIGLKENDDFFVEEKTPKI